MFSDETKCEAFDEGEKELPKSRLGVLCVYFGGDEAFLWRNDDDE